MCQFALEHMADSMQTYFEEALQMAAGRQHGGPDISSGVQIAQRAIESACTEQVADSMWAALHSSGAIMTGINALRRWRRAILPKGTRRFAVYKGARTGVRFVGRGIGSQARQILAIRSPLDVLRYGRQQMWPVGSRRFEAYKRVRRSLFPNANYSNELYGALRSVAKPSDTSGLPSDHTVHDPDVLPAKSTLEHSSLVVHANRDDR
jgi:hypothetical protein